MRSKLILMLALLMSGTASAQSLIAVNTGSGVALAAGSPSHPTVPSGSPSSPTIFNITGYMTINLSGDWTALESQRVGLSGTLRYAWVGPPSYGTGTLLLDPSVVTASATTTAPGLISAADRIQLNTQNVIAPGLHGIKGDGTTADDVAINAYLNALAITYHNYYYNSDQAAGAVIHIAKGTYRLSAPIILPNAFTLLGAGSNPVNAGSMFLADAGVNAFVIKNNANGATIRDIVIAAAGKLPLANTHGVLDHDPGQPITTGGAGSYALTLTNSGDASGYHNGDVIRIEGGSLSPGTIYNLTVNATLGSATASYNNSDGNIYSGLWEGQYLILGSAWPTRTRVLSVDYNAHTFTMATASAANVHLGSIGDPAKVVYVPDSVVQIQSGGTTVNLVIEDNSIAPSVSTYIHHYAAAIYAETQIHLEHIWISGFKGPGLVHLGSGVFVPSGFAEFSTVLGFDVFASGMGFYGKGVDCNSTTYTNMSANFIDQTGIYTEQNIGITFLHPITQGAYIGFAGGATSNQSIIIINPYSEGTTNSFGSGLMRFGGNGPYWGEAVGVLSNGQVVNGSDAAGTAGFVTNGSISPQSRGQGNLGVTAGEWGQIWGQIYGGRLNDVTGHGAVNVSTSLGETIRFTGDGAAISSLTLAAGQRGQMLSLIVTQDHGNTTTWPTTIGNAKLIGGVWAKTLGADKEDNLLFRSDGVTWRQITPTATNLQ